MSQDRRNKLLKRIDLTGATVENGILILERQNGLLPPIEVPLTGGGINSNVDIQAFDVAGDYEWIKPDGAQRVEVWLVAGGGGGGSGRRNISGGGGGGAGGGGAGISRRLFAASDLGAVEILRVGAGGPGGAAITGDSTPGQNGTAGADSFFGSSILPQYIVATGGNGGLGGSAGTVAGATAGTGDFAAGLAGGNGTAASGGNAAPHTNTAGLISVLRCGGGGGGGRTGLTGHGSELITPYITVGDLDTWSGRAVNSTAGRNIGGLLGVGGGGSGGTGTGIPGGTGGPPGGGGGGGSPGVNVAGPSPIPSGAGGRGGDGYVVVTTWR